MKITKISWTVVLLFTVFITMNTSCQRKDKQNQTGVHIPPYEKNDHVTSSYEKQDHINTPYEEPDSSTNEDNENVEKFKKEWDKKMDKLDKKINKAQQELKNVSGENKENLKEKIEEMKVKKNELRKEIDQAEDNAGQQWDSFKQKVNNRYDSLSSAASAIGNEQ